MWRIDVVYTNKGYMIFSFVSTFYCTERLAFLLKKKSEIKGFMHHSCAMRAWDTLHQKQSESGKLCNIFKKVSFYCSKIHASLSASRHTKKSKEHCFKFSNSVLITRVWVEENMHLGEIMKLWNTRNWRS